MAKKQPKKKPDILDTIKNRIVGYGTKPASQFQANPHNWRVHPQAQREALAASLREVGWVATVIENVRTGHLIDGHERVWQALQANDAEVPYVQVDLSEEEEALVLATLDPIGAMAQADAAKLEELLREIHTGEEALQEFLDDLARSTGAFLEENTAGQITIPATYIIVIEVDSEEEQLRLVEEFLERGLKCRAFVS